MPVLDALVEERAQYPAAAYSTKRESRVQRREEQHKAQTATSMNRRKLCRVAAFMPAAMPLGRAIALV
jgi:hypothetical protein